MKLIKGYFLSIFWLTLITFSTSILTKDIINSYDSSKNLNTLDALIVTANTVAGNILFLTAPYALATVEHILDDNITYGDCRVKNIKNVQTGFYHAGTVVVSTQNRTEKHIRSYIYLNNKFIPVDYTCPDDICYFINTAFIIQVENHKIVDYKIIEKSLNSYLNFIYTVTAIEIQKLKRGIAM